MVPPTKEGEGTQPGWEPMPEETRFIGAGGFSREDGDWSELEVEVDAEVDVEELVRVGFLEGVAGGVVVPRR